MLAAIRQKPIVSTLIAVGLIWILWVSFGSNGFHACVTEQEIIQAQRMAPEHTGAISFSLWFLSGVFTRCSWRLMYSERDALTALATVLIAWFTFTLWNTNRAQLGAVKETIDLSRLQFDAEHRPWLEICDPTPSGDITFNKAQTNIRIKYLARNYGNLPATEYIFYAKVISIDKQQSINHEIKSIIQSYTNIKQSHIADRIPAKVIFPGEPVPDEKEIVFDIEEGSHPFGTAGRLFSPILIVVACYRSPSSKNTMFYACPYYVLIDGASRHIDGNTVEELTTISQDRVTLKPWFMGATAG